MEEILKKCNGQSGDDANALVRNKRIEIRVSPRECALIDSYARTSGYNSRAQYLRESGLRDRSQVNDIPMRKALQAAQYEINRLGNNVNQIAKHLNAGNAIDEETRLVLLQIQEFAAQLVHIARAKQLAGGSE